MKLNKRYSRNIKDNLSFYVSSTVLTIMSLFMFFMMNIAGNSIIDFYAVFSKNNRVENANFTVYTEIPDDEIEDLEEKYDLELEKQRFINIDTDGTTARVFHSTSKIDLYEMTVGRDVLSDDEIVISEGYAVNMKVNTGDRIKVGEKEYTVTGFFQRPDYLYMVENPDDSYKNISTFFLAYMTDEEFDKLENTNCQYLVRYSKDNDMEFRREINDTYVMRTYLSDNDNARIKMVDFQAEMFVEMSYIILAVMPLIAVALISIIISRKVKSEQKMIGTLTALGYTKGKLMLHYAGFAVIPGILGGVLSSALAAIFAQSFGELGLQDYEPLRIVCHLDPFNALLGIVIPTLMYAIAALLSVRKLLGKDTVLLLNGNADGKDKNLKKVLVGKKLSFKIKFAVRSLIGNPSRTFVVFLSIFLGSYIILLGYSFFDSADFTMKNGIDDLGSFSYEYILNTLITDESYGGEAILAAQLEGDDGRKFTLMGTSPDNKYMNLKTTDGNNADLENGWYFTSVAAMLSDIQTGDTAVLYNPLTLEKYEIKVDGIIANDMQCGVFTNMENASEILGVECGTYNALMSGEELDIPENIIVQTIKKTDSADQLKTMMDQMDIMLYFLIGIGVIICVASIYVAVNMLVTENRTNISMLKVLGYSDKRINGIVLRVNHVMLPIGILVSVPAVILSCDFLLKWMAEFIGMAAQVSIAPRSYIIAIVLTAASYFGSLLLVSRKVKNVDMVESLKDNRE